LVRANWRRVRLWSELVFLFGGVPLLMAAYFDNVIAWGVLGAFSLIVILAVLGTVAAVLLAITPGFTFRRLLTGPVLREWKLILACSALAAAVCSAAVLILLPDNFLSLPFYNSSVWLVILGAYPVLSALPQELIYRVLFFERYGALFPGTMAAVAANGAAFGFGHLFYMHSLTIALTAIGGALIGWAYLTRGRSVLLTWVLHSISGWLIFTSGLGVYFHSGAVPGTP
jgi:membrane protease YdiL (CAAX protease family)